MALLDRDYMRATPRTHVGETQRPGDLSWLQGPPPARQSHFTAIAVVTVLVLAAVIVAVLLVSGTVTFAG